MANLSQQKRERMLAFLDRIRKEHIMDEDTLIAINEIENELTRKKYGLVWEEHEERVDTQMRLNIPIFSEVVDKTINSDKNSRYNFLLEGDNLHSLRLLEKSYKNSIDVIYIDPPYNTGKKDFVYDDVYIDSNDGFIHSKWLSFMYKRLIIARGLISNDGVIVISIGYQEVNNLILLCQELFDDKQVTCVTVQTSGGKPNGGFTFVHEYLVFIAPNNFMPNSMNFTGGIERSPFEGLTLSTFSKTNRPNQAYPIFIDDNNMNIVGIGKSLAERIKEGCYTGDPADFKFDFNEAPEGTSALWPISSKGVECVWRLIPSRLLEDWEKGYIKVIKNKAKNNPNNYSIQYLPDGVIKKIISGDLEVLGRQDGAPTLILGKNRTEGGEIPTIWTEKEFYTTKGTDLIKDIFKSNQFSYPKPLELITEIIRAVSKENSIILDFFAGSGTTAHAVLELNKEDGGNRSFILCTNNENGICENVTYPRIKTVITGIRPDGSEYSNGIPANLKYYRTGFVPKSAYEMQEDLLGHIGEMVQLEHGVDLDDRQHIIVLDDDAADELEENWSEYPGLKGIYISSDVLLTAEQQELFESVDLNIIPEYYFEAELREAGQAL